MRIAHLCLSNWYVPGFAYQENQLVARHVADGHKVLVIASTEVMTKSGKVEYWPASRITQNDGVEVIRLPYSFWPLKLARKLRVHPGLYELLRDFRPDTILFHGSAGWEVQTAARYARDNPEVLYYIDSHEDKNNSARGFVSREILHKLYYRSCLSRAMPHVRKLLCYSTESIDFVTEYYRIPRDRTELFPLGGNIPDDDQYTEKRNRTRSSLGVQATDIVFIQSGKQTRAKKLLDTLTAFRALANPKAKLLIAGSLDPEVEKAVMEIVGTTPNISFLGWQTPESLEDLLCAADVYVQPGTQSATMQNSMCCRCAQIIRDVPAHHAYANANGWLIKTDEDLQVAMRQAMEQDILAMGVRSHQKALEMLDYRKLANRVLKP
jgi:1,2-diacylglycerol 3-alpha-glucosyltransferase